MLSSPPPEEAADARELRGALFTDMDRLAFALEVEACDLITAGMEEEARRTQELRLGVRLAQRLVSGVYAEEVNGRIDLHSEAYASRLEPIAR